MLSVLSLQNDFYSGKIYFAQNTRAEQKTQKITQMDALDLVKEVYADNFEKVDQDTNEDYYYKLPFANYYLVYEGGAEEDPYYTIHLYEFVLDDPEYGLGHSVTYGWYQVDKMTGNVTALTLD
jgi:hypothetical protein